MMMISEPYEMHRMFSLRKTVMTWFLYWPGFQLHRPLLRIFSNLKIIMRFFIVPLFIFLTCSSYNIKVISLRKEACKKFLPSCLHCVSMCWSFARNLKVALGRLAYFDFASISFKRGVDSEPLAAPVVEIILLQVAIPQWQATWLLCGSLK